MNSAAIDKCIATILQQVPWFIWIVIAFLFFWGLISIIRKAISLVQDTRKSYIEELKGHLDFKEKIITDFTTQNAQLEQQNAELKIETERKENLINTIIDDTRTMLNKKDEQILRLESALAASLWIFEREIFLREVMLKIFMVTVTRSSVPEDIDAFLQKNANSLISLMRLNSGIHYQQAVDVTNAAGTSGFLDIVAPSLAEQYLELPIKEEINLFNKLRDEMKKLPSFKESNE